MIRSNQGSNIYILRGDDDALFQIDQHALLEFCACSQKQQFSCRLGAPQHNILIFNQSVLAVIP
jgi:hypothetical protein